MKEELPAREADGSCAATSQDLGPWSNFVLSLSSPESPDRSPSLDTERVASIFYTSTFFTYFLPFLLFCILIHFIHLKHDHSNHFEIEYYSEL